MQNVELIRRERSQSPLGFDKTLPLDAVSDQPPDRTTADAIEGPSDPGTLMDFELNAANHLHGLSLIEGFKKFVLDDPEVVALSKPVVAADEGHAAVFRDGQAPGPFVDFHWPLDLSASEIAFRFVSLPHGDDPTPSAAICAVSKALADRIGALREILAGGKLVAFGTFADTGIEGPIGRLQWLRSGISIDVSNGRSMRRSRLSRDTEMDRSESTAARRAATAERTTARDL